MSTLEIRSLRIDERSQLLALVNQEFIFSRGRTLTLENRFPRLFDDCNLENCIAALDGAGKILSICCSEPRIVRDSNEIVFLVGCVMTIPEARGKGLAGALLKRMESHFISQGVRGAFLWTGLNGFYEQFGWRREDHTELLILHDVVSLGGAKYLPNVNCDEWRKIAECDSTPFQRDAKDYFSVLPPADCAFQYLLEDGSFLCGGYRNGIGYVYDVKANKWETLYDLITSFAEQANAEEIWMNLLPERHATEICWLKKFFCQMEVKKTNLQMYWAADSDATEKYKSVTIPFLDRI